MPDLNPRQFGLSGEDPNQLALPGMEKMSHPWAEHLSRGLTLAHEYDPHEDFHVLQAQHDISSGARTGGTGDHGVYGELIWKGHRQAEGAPNRNYAPGEITWVENVGRHPSMPAGVQERSRGIAGAMMRSAHHFDIGQTTLPLHSAARTEFGDNFADKVMPELKPVGRMPFSKGHKPIYDTRPEHPYEIQERMESTERAKKMRPPRPAQRERLFPVKR